MMRKLDNEKTCEVCKCLFISKDGSTLCKGCASHPESAGPRERFIYKDVKRSDMEKKLNIIIDKLNKLLVLMGSEDEDDKPKGYVKTCDTCGETFVSEAPAAKYCDKCKSK